MIFRKTNTFSQFEQCLPDYNNDTILDFGGNRGNLISSSNKKILPENYTCLDISTDSLKLCSQENPGVETIHWNRYHENYNPTGNNLEPFPLLKRYDIVFANSVFTHSTLDEMLYCIDNLMLYADRLVFTYIDPKNKEFISKFTEKYYPIKFDQRQVSYVIDESNNIFWSAFDTEYLIEKLSSYVVRTGKTDWFNYVELKNHR